MIIHRTSRKYQLNQSLKPVSQFMKAQTQNGDCFSEERVELNMMISENGPKLERANSVPEASMSKYCSSTKGPSGTECEDYKT